MNDERIFGFRCPPYLLSALAAAARADYCSKSDVIRQALVKTLSERGLMKQDQHAA